LVVAVTIFVVQCTAQAGTTGKIAGKVTNTETGETMPGANVVIEGTTYEAATDMNGSYFILNVQSGL
jgi:hypothetical protein